MSEKPKEKDSTIPDIISIFDSDSKFAVDPRDDVDYGELHFAPIRDLFKDHDKLKSKRSD